MSPPNCQGGIASSSARRPTQCADAHGPADLVPAERVEVDAQVVEAHRQVRRALRAVADDERTVASRTSAAISCTGFTVPSAFETCGEGDDARARREQRRAGASRSIAPVGRELRDAEASRRCASASCCHGTKLAWCSIAVTTISSPAPTFARPQLPRDEVDRLGRAAREDQAVGVRRRRGSARRSRVPRGRRRSRRMLSR